MDGKADGSYLIGKETKAKLEPLSTLPVNGPVILTIKVLPLADPILLILSIIFLALRASLEFCNAK